MNQDAKQAFIVALIRNIQADILAKVPQMPEDWDGHELRRYIADKFAESSVTLGRPGPYGKPYGKRYRRYKNEVIVRNL
jgi:hypothetical protein